MSASASHIGAYTKVDVETASQGKLIVMLFNGAIKRAEEAKRQLEKGKRQEVHNNLIRAQDILAELRGALDMKTGEIARNLDRLYEYMQHLLVQANIHKKSEPIDECVEHMTALRDTWDEVFRGINKTQAPKPAQSNQHGSSVLNLRG
jgi:flagellar protein FliS